MRYFITIGSPDCPNLGLPPLAKVASDVEAVAGLLAEESQGYSRALAAELPLGAPSGVIKHELGEWFLGDARTESDCVVIYVAGHGDSHGQFGAHCLLTSDTKPRAIYTAVKTGELVDLIFAAARYPRNVLLILDVCFAGKGAGEVIAEIGRSLKKGFPSGAGFWVIATADRNTEAYDGAFVRAWQALMADKSGAWLSSGGKRFLYPADFAYAVNEHLGLSSRQRVIPLGVGGPDVPTFIKNPWYTPEARRIECGHREPLEPEGARRRHDRRDQVVLHRAGGGAGGVPGVVAGGDFGRTRPRRHGGAGVGEVGRARAGGAEPRRARARSRELTLAGSKRQKWLPRSPSSSATRCPGPTI